MKPQHIILAIAVSILWGGNFVAIRETVTQVPPIFVTAIRFLIQGLILAPFVGFDWEKIKKLIPYAIVMGVGHFSLIFLGISGVDASVAGVVMQLNTPLLAIFAWWFLGDKFGWVRKFGIGVSLVGIIIVAGEPQTASAWGSVLLLFLSSICWALGNIQLKRLKDFNPIQTMAWMSMLATPILLTLSFINENQQLNAIIMADSNFWISLTYMAIGSSIGGYGLWYYLLSRYGVSSIGHYNFLVPLFAIISGYFILDEPITFERSLGCAITVIGVGIVQLRTTLLRNQRGR